MRPLKTVKAALADPKIKSRLADVVGTLVCQRVRDRYERRFMRYSATRTIGVISMGIRWLVRCSAQVQRFVRLFGTVFLGASLSCGAGQVHRQWLSKPAMRWRAKRLRKRLIGLRVVWTQVTGIDARLRYEFDVKLGQSLAALKIPRVMEWSTSLDNDKYIIRNSDFTKIVSDAIGAPSSILTLNGAPYIIAVPDPWLMNVQIKFDVTETRPDKPPHIVSSNLELVGEIEPGLDPDQLNQLVLNSYGRYIPATLKNVVLRERLKMVSNEEWKAFLATLGETGDHPEVLGLTDMRTRVIRVRPGVPPAGILHELIHLYASLTMHDPHKMSPSLREGITNYLAQEVGKPKVDLSWAYEVQTKIAEALAKAVGLDVVARAYFGTDKDFADMAMTLDNKRGSKDLLLAVQLMMQQKNYSEAYGLIVGR